MRSYSMGENHTTGEYRSEVHYNKVCVSPPANGVGSRRLLHIHFAYHPLSSSSVFD